MSGAEPFRVSRVRPSHLTPPLHVRGNWRDMALLLPLRCPLRRWLARLLLRLLLHRYQCQLYQELVACDVFVAFCIGALHTLRSIRCAAVEGCRMLPGRKRVLA